MSGGHFNYLCYTIEDTYGGEMENIVMEEMLQDFCKVLKSLEWYKSGDTGQEDYQKDVEDFLTKWTKTDTAIYLKAKSDLIDQLKQSCLM